MVKYLRFSHILESRSSYMTLHPIPSEFPLILRKCCFFFFSVFFPFYYYKGEHSAAQMNMKKRENID
jgi:hypothetical protein